MGRIEILEKGMVHRKTGFEFKKRTLWVLGCPGEGLRETPLCGGGWKTIKRH